MQRLLLVSVVYMDLVFPHKFSQDIMYESDYLGTHCQLYIFLIKCSNGGDNSACLHNDNELFAVVTVYVLEKD